MAGPRGGMVGLKLARLSLNSRGRWTQPAGPPDTSQGEDLGEGCLLPTVRRAGSFRNSEDDWHVLILSKEVRKLLARRAHCGLICQRLSWPGIAASLQSWPWEASVPPTSSCTNMGIASQAFLPGSSVWRRKPSREGSWPQTRVPCTFLLGLSLGRETAATGDPAPG